MNLNIDSKTMALIEDPSIGRHLDQGPHAAMVRAERMRQYMSRQRLIALSGVLPAMYLAWLHWPRVDHQTLILWWVALFLVDLLTLVHTSFYLKRLTRHGPEPLSHAWLHRQVVLQSLAGLVWGSSVLLFRADEVGLVDRAIVLLAVTAVCVIGLLPYRRAVVGYGVGIWCLPLATMFFDGQAHHFQLALGILVLLLSFNFYLWEASKQLVEGIEQRFQAVALSDALHGALVRINELATHARVSEERLRLLTSQIPGMVFVQHVDPEGTDSYRFVSAAVRQIYGLSPEEVMHDPSLLARYRHPDDAASFDRHMHELQSGSPDSGFEFRIVLPDGKVRWLYRRSDTVSNDASGRVQVGLLLDITDRKEAEAALRENEAIWKLALESSGDGVWDLNHGTGEEYVSPRLAAMYGFEDEELARWLNELDERTHPDDRPQMLADRAAHLEGRTPVYRNEHRIRSKDGSWKWVLTRGMVIQRDDTGRPLRMVGTHTDISDLKAAEAHQRTLEAQLRESQKMEAIGTLAGGVAHDFNNLVAAILGNLALAREDVGPDHLAQESLAEINRAAVRARELVQQILAFSRRQPQALRRQALLPLVEEGLRLLRSLLPAGVQLSARLGDAPMPVMADATQVQQVLMNLCTNAWQAAGDRPAEITVALDEVSVDAAKALQLGGVDVGHYVCLSVADNGPGMDAETRRRIFEPFFTTKEFGTSTGLGLAVVHGIVKAHKGAIEVHSAPGEGARFEVYLPLAPSIPAAPVPAPPVSPPAPSVVGRHIVYVDDYEALVFLAARLLRKHGYRVSTFVSGTEALAWMQGTQEPVDLVVTDQNMPGMSGVELSAAIKALRPTQRVVIVTGHVNDRLIAEAGAAGVEEVLGKQDSMSALAEAVRQLLEPAA